MTPTENNEGKAAEYRKLIAALVGGIALLLSSSGIVVDSQLLDFVITALTAYAVWRLPNAPQLPADPGDPLAERDRLPR